MEIPDAVRGFLDERRFAVVATINPDGTPQQTVLWYELEGDDLLLNTAAGRLKDSNLRRDARISACVEDGYRYVTIRGTARFIEDQTVAQADIHRLAIRYNGEEVGNRQAEETFSKQRRISIRVPIERISIYGFDE